MIAAVSLSLFLWIGLAAKCPMVFNDTCCLLGATLLVTLAAFLALKKTGPLERGAGQ